MDFFIIALQASTGQALLFYGRLEKMTVEKGSKVSCVAAKHSGVGTE